MARSSLALAGLRWRQQRPHSFYPPPFTQPPPSTPTPQPTIQPSPTSTPTRIVQVNLLTHPKIYQYDWPVFEEFGNNACGLVAATAPFVSPSDPAYIKVMKSIVNNAPKNSYGKGTRIQPSKYVQGLKGVFGAGAIKVHDNWNIDGMFDALVNGEIVIADMQVQKGTEIPSIEAENYAHFARVLGIDLDVNEIYIENTLNGASYWVIALDVFENSIWVYPEVGVSLAQNDAEPVTKWAVTIAAGATPLGIPTPAS